MYFSETERITLRDEVVHFMSGIATVIQDLSSTMDDVASECSSSRLRYYQIVISDLMHVSEERGRHLAGVSDDVQFSIMTNVYIVETE